MTIKNVKINGVRNPVGFDLKKINLSYYVDGEPNGEFYLHIYDKDGKEIYTQKLNYSNNYYNEIDFVAQKEQRYEFDITCGEDRSEKYFFETATDFDCPFVTPVTDLTHPIIFKEFNCGNVKKARLYVTGLGLYVAKINGNKVGNEYLTPDCNDYENYVQYQTYDVTEMLTEQNLIEIELGNGWYKGRFGLKHRENIYGSEYVCAAKLVLWDDDGKKTVIHTDETWHARSSNVKSSGIYDGEIVDDTLTEHKVCNVRISGMKYNPVPRISLPVVVKGQIKPTLIVSPLNEKILDFGQNFSGIVAFKNFVPKGYKIRLQAGEVLQKGCFFRDNLRTAKAEYIYISDGSQKIIEPKFTFYGFRYMLVEYDGDIDVADFTGKVLYSDLDESVEFETDNAKINRLLKNCLWGQKSNFLDVPTDCPQRDERLGWTGDAEVFCTTACYQMDCRAFYSKYITDLAVEQDKLNGKIPSYAPMFKENDVASSVWADAITIIPWSVYKFYGDKHILEQSFPQMQRYVDTIIANDDENGGNRLYNFGFHLGDWLSQDGIGENALRGATSEYFIASCYYHHSVWIVAQSARILGFSDQAEYYGKIADEIRNSILNEYFSSSGRLAVDTQTAYVLCTMFEIYKDKAKLYRGFARRIKKDCFSIKGGFVGATRLIQALIKSGLTDEAFQLLYSEKFPSWLHCVNLGATTIWERWNSLNDDGSISGTGMNSLNHYSFGAVAEAMYRYIAGINPTDTAFKSVRIEPKFNYRLKNLNCNLKSPSGEFKVKYSVLESGQVELKIKIPYGVNAVLVLPDRKDSRLSCGESVFTVDTDKNLIHPFSIDTSVSDILSNDKSSNVLKRMVPALYGFLTNNSIGMEGYSLRALTALNSFYVPEQLLKQIDLKLKEIAV